jgi:hypothetical protein
LLSRNLHLLGKNFSSVWKISFNYFPLLRKCAALLSLSHKHRQVSFLLFQSKKKNSNPPPLFFPSANRRSDERLVNAVRLEFSANGKPEIVAGTVSVCVPTSWYYTGMHNYQFLKMIGGRAGGGGEAVWGSGLDKHSSPHTSVNATASVHLFGPARGVNYRDVKANLISRHFQTFFCALHRRCIHRRGVTNL